MDYGAKALGFLYVRDQTTSTGQSLGLLNWTGKFSWGYEINNCPIGRATGIYCIVSEKDTEEK